MQVLMGMAYSDTVVQDVLKMLLHELGDEAVISQTMIAERAGIPLTTCQYALRRLMRANRVIGDFSVGIGYRYRIGDGRSSTATAPPARK